MLTSRRTGSCCKKRGPNDRHPAVLALLACGQSSVVADRVLKNKRHKDEVQARLPDCTLASPQALTILRGRLRLLVVAASGPQATEPSRPPHSQMVT